MKEKENKTGQREVSQWKMLFPEREQATKKVRA